MCLVSLPPIPDPQWPPWGQGLYQLPESLLVYKHINSPLHIVLTFFWFCLFVVLGLISKPSP